MKTIHTLLATVVVFNLGIGLSHAEQLTQLTAHLDNAQSVTSDPATRDHRTDSRDHRSSNPDAHPGGGVSVGSGQTAPHPKCVKFFLGGPCVGGATEAAAEGVKHGLEDPILNRAGAGPTSGAQTRDHRAGN